MITSIALSLDKRRSKKDGTYPLIFRLSHQGQTTNIRTKVSLAPTDWNNQSRKIKKTFKGVTSVSRLNNELEKRKAEFLDIINELEENNQLSFLTIKELKSHILKEHDVSDFCAFTDSLIKQMEEANKFGNAQIYKHTLSALKNFTNKEHIQFEEITYTFLKEFEIAHLKKGNSLNGLSTYMRTIRAIYNRAIKQGIVLQDAYPFQQYKIKSQPTAKRAISLEAIKTILNLDLEADNPLFHARNYFISSYLMNGISFVDMAFLKVSNIVDGRIQYKRQKTARHYNIKVTEQLASILDFYLEGKDHDDFIFPIVTRNTSKDQYNDVRWARKRYNKDLKEIANLCKIEENLTSYVSRHSMATNLILKDVPVNALSKMLGHNKISTTEIYIKGLPTHIMDEY